LTSPRSRILIIDDDSLALSAEIRLLASAGYEVFSAASGEEALGLVGLRRPDLLLLDINLPDMSGVEVCRRVRMDARNADIFIVLLSESHIDGGSQAQGYEDCADAYITRPIASRDLLARIQAYLRIKIADSAVRDSEERFRLVADYAPIMIWSFRADGVRDYFNRSWFEYTGRSFEQNLSGGWMESLHPEDRAHCQAVTMESLSIHKEYKLEYRLRRADGEYGWFLESAFPRFTPAEDFIGYLGTCVDLTENRLLRDQIDNLKTVVVSMESDLQAAIEAGTQSAHTDAMTGVHNRRYLYEIAEHEIGVARRYRQPLAVTRFDLDHFKYVNDAFGHAVGDQVLQRVCQIVRAEMRAADIFGRNGEDDFIILQPVTSAHSARILAERIRAAVEALAIPVPVEQGSLILTISVGIDEVIMPVQEGEPEQTLANGSDSVDDLFLRAEQAMLAAKAAGRNRCALHPRLR